MLDRFNHIHNSETIESRLELIFMIILDFTSFTIELASQFFHPSVMALRLFLVAILGFERSTHHIASWVGRWQYIGHIRLSHPEIWDSRLPPMPPSLAPDPNWQRPPLEYSHYSTTTLRLLVSEYYRYPVAHVRGREYGVVSAEI
jgi:hypothetical protein